MMGAKRQLQRAKLAVERKKVKRAQKEIKALMNAIPGGCNRCGTSFTPRETPEQLDTWTIKATRTRADLTCDKCQTLIDANE